MSVAGISSAFPTTSNEASAPGVSRRQSEDAASRQLIQDLKSGDMAGAEQAYTTLSGFGPNNSGPWTNAQMQSEFQSLGQDLQSGNLTGAQSAITYLAGNQLSTDRQVATQDYQSGNMTAYNQAMQNLDGDFWAVYGQQAQPPSGPPNGGPAPSSGVNVQA